MSDPRTNAGSKFYIAVNATDDALPQNTALTQAQYEALDWLEVKSVGMIGETGTTTNIPTYDTLATTVTSKSKGISNAGDPDIEMARIPGDPGQTEMLVAAATKHNYAFKIEKDDMPSVGTSGSIFYNRGVVTGPRHPNGRNEDFDLAIFTLGLNQLEIVVDAE